MHRSENVAFDAVSCATARVLSEGGPAKWLKNKNLENHLCDFEPDHSASPSKARMWVAAVHTSAMAPSTRAGFR